MTTWLTPTETRAEPYWPECEVDDDDALARLLASARTSCEAFAPQLEDGVDVPENYRLAQASQARAVWRAGGGTNDGTDLGGGEYAVTVYPLDWNVKALLRPKRGRPAIA